MNLRQALRRTGTANLSQFVGLDTVNAVKDILSKDITESNMVEILVERLGSQILSNAQIRSSIFKILPVEDLSYIHHGDKEASKDRALANKNITWGRTQIKAQRLLEVLELDESFLPDEAEVIQTETLLSPHYHLFDYQKKIKNRAVEVISQPCSRLMIHMPTGAGKTRTSAELLVDFWRAKKDLSGLTVWLAHSEELCQQAAETISSVWNSRGDEKLKCYKLWSGTSNPETFEGPGFIVASLQRIYAMWKSNDSHKNKLIEDIRKNCDLIIIDEAHKAVAPTYQDAIEVLDNLQTTRVLGLTATPGRGDDFSENKKLIDFFHGNKITLQDDNSQNLEDPIGYLQDRKYLAKIDRKPVPTNIDIDLSPSEIKHLEQFYELPASLIKKLGDDSERNALIILELAKLHEEGRTIIVFACSVKHSRMLTDLCRIRGIEAKSIDGQTAKVDRKKWIQEFKQGEFKILINYGVLTTGFDAPNTDTVFITRPTSSVVLYSQMIGRGIRGLQMGGNERCLLVDLEDNLKGYPNESKAFNYFDWTEGN